MKIRHNKIKNTGILFESLARQITADVLENKNSSIAAKIIKQFFNKNTELRKELSLYQSLIKESFSSEVKAASFVDTVLESRKNLNNSKLRREKYEIIKQLKENFSIENLFSSRIDSYPVYASIYKLFEYNSLLTENVKPIEITDAKFTVVEHLVRKVNKQPKKSEVSEILVKEPIQIRMLTQKIIIDEFNKNFSNKLTEDQKSLVKDYINNVSNTNPLRESISKRLPLIESKLLKLSKVVPDDAIRIKLLEVNNSVSKLKNIKNIKENHILGLLRTYSLIDEINSHMKKSGCKK